MDKIRLGGNLLLLENSELLCSLGGRIRIFYTLAAASAACGASREEERSFWSKAIDFGKGLGKYGDCSLIESFAEVIIFI